MARTVVEALVGRARGGTLTVTDGRGALGPVGQNGVRRSRSHAIAPIDVRMIVHDPRTYRRILHHGSVGLGESYADGWWDTDDLTGLLRLALRSLRPTHAPRDRLHRALRPLIDPVSRLRRPDPARDERDVRAHYDLGNEFFQRLLDDTMAYSCAYFDGPDTPLVDASRSKFDRIARMLDLKPGDRLLEIGTGWGGFALHAAEHYGCLVTTTTVSARQHEFARRRVLRAGLADRITVLDRDYRDLTGEFDKAVAIEMIEAVDWRDYEQFFACLRDRLTDDGALAMQSIVVPDGQFDRLKRHTDFIKAAIFPGGCLPSTAALDRAAERAGLTPAHHADIGIHYGETLRRWRTNLEAIALELAAEPELGLDQHFTRLWDFYFAYCEAGFEERYISVAQSVYSAAPAAGRSGVVEQLGPVGRP